MSQAKQTNIIVGPWAQPFQSPTAIQQFWDEYQRVAADKRRIYSRFDSAASVGTHEQVSQAEAACDRAYEVLADLADAILQKRPTAAIDLAIKAQVVARREADLGGPCDEGEIAAFCRDVHTLLGRLSTR